MTKRIIAMTVLVGLGIPAAVFAQSSGVTRFNPGAQFKTRERKPLAADLLLKAVESVDWEDTTFEEVLDWFRAESEDRINIIPRWSALAVEGIDNDSLITLKLNDTNVAEVLNEVLDQLSPAGALGYRAKGNAIRLSTKTDFGRKLEIRTYSILDLVFDVPDFGRSFPAVDLQAASRSGGGGGGGGGQSIFGGSTSQSDELEVEEQEVKERVSELIAIIATTINPDSWGPIEGTGRGAQIGGAGRGMIRSFNNRTLVVYNTIEVHEKIAGFFAVGQ
ncbi:MAG: hypothetical protein IIB57_14880 [Planctomycetes bacterium]|nr:hypothetical protein [Planctomycetota bacterium]